MPTEFCICPMMPVENFLHKRGAWCWSGKVYHMPNLSAVKDWLCWNRTNAGRKSIYLQYDFRLRHVKAKVQVALAKISWLGLAKEPDYKIPHLKIRVRIDGLCGKWEERRRWRQYLKSYLYFSENIHIFSLKHPYLFPKSSLCFPKNIHMFSLNHPYVLMKSCLCLT